jgi:mannose/fructose/N-acetylgalactosamine-specific phosphotransferase system component IIB
MAITFLRVDDRIIHGQITTRWSKEFPCDAIVAVNDHAATTSFIKASFLSATGKPTYIWTYAEWLEKCDKVLQSNKNYFLITKEPMLMAKILIDDNFVPGPKLVVVGPANDRPGAVKIGNNQSLMQNEADAFEKIHQAGYQILFALVKEDAIGYWPKFRSMFGYK